jgi:hypothetical protein
VFTVISLECSLLPKYQWFGEEGNSKRLGQDLEDSIVQLRSSFTGRTQTGRSVNFAISSTSGFIVHLIQSKPNACPLAPEADSAKSVTIESEAVLEHGGEFAS